MADEIDGLPGSETPDPQKDYVIGEHKVWTGNQRPDDYVVYPSTSGDYATICISDKPEDRPTGSCTPAGS